MFVEITLSVHLCVCSDFLRATPDTDTDETVPVYYLRMCMREDNPRSKNISGDHLCAIIMSLGLEVASFVI